MSRRHLQADLTLLPTGEGREGPITATYRSLARFVGTDLDIGFELRLDDSEFVPRQTGRGTLSFWGVDDVPDVAPGTGFEMRGGGRVGRGV